MNKITIVSHITANPSQQPGMKWYAYVYVGDVLHTQARNRDQGAAVADAVAKFRTARYDRITSAKTL